jgi:hypothetical protein
VAVRRATMKSLLWFWAVILLALSFPMQVYFESPLPSLLPYVLIGVIFWLTRFQERIRPRQGRSPGQSRNISLMVWCFLSLILLNTSWQISFGVITVNEGISSLAIFFLPVVFFWYFRRTASEIEIRGVLLAIVVAGLIVGLYFAWDSYLKLALGQISDYALRAFQYSLDRANAGATDANTARVNLGSRSLGLLEHHSVSGAWVVLGALAALALLPQDRRILRRGVVWLFGSMLFLGLNFTAIIAFAIIVYLLEFGGVAALRGRVSKRTLPSLMSFVALGGLAVVVVLWMAGELMSDFVRGIVFGQMDLLFGTGESTGNYADLVTSNMAGYIRHVSDAPFTLLIGDGFSSYGLPRGGDTGLIETMAMFGLPFFWAVLFGLLGLVMAGTRQVEAAAGRGVAEPESSRILRFAIGVSLLVLITEGHYTVWPTKSILPLLFFSLAIYDRHCMPRPRRLSVDQPGERP